VDDAQKGTWMDLTIRPQVAVEVELQPDSTVEASWALPGGSRLTILLRPDDAASLKERISLLLLMVDR
jgi:hypothetical protein